MSSLNISIRAHITGLMFMSLLAHNLLMLFLICLRRRWGPGLKGGLTFVLRRGVKQQKEIFPFLLQVDRRCYLDDLHANWYWRLHRAIFWDQTMSFFLSGQEREVTELWVTGLLVLPPKSYRTRSPVCIKRRSLLVRWHWHWSQVKAHKRFTFFTY